MNTIHYLLFSILLLSSPLISEPINSEELPSSPTPASMIEYVISSTSILDTNIQIISPRPDGTYVEFPTHTELIIQTNSRKEIFYLVNKLPNQDFLAYENFSAKEYIITIQKDHQKYDTIFSLVITLQKSNLPTIKRIIYVK